MRNRSPILYTLLVILAGYFRWKKTYFADKNIFLLFSIISRGYRKGILAWNGLVMVFIMSVRIMKGLREWFGLFKWMQVFKNRPSKISGRQTAFEKSFLFKKIDPLFFCDSLTWIEKWIWSISASSLSNYFSLIRSVAAYSVLMALYYPFSEEGIRLDFWIGLIYWSDLHFTLIHLTVDLLLLYFSKKKHLMKWTH